ncbi:ribonuclease Z [Candidatus Woesearchaeota archaeon]|nr:ribonuclease Z [Candidatus Woesearchaeota archaeon]
MEVILLGTSSMVPTEERNHSGAWLRYKEENILIDCGEGTQRQIRKAKISAMKITKILITHWHGDHILGLPGLFLTLGSQGYSTPLEIYGPRGSKEYVQRIMQLFVPRETIQYKVIEVDKGTFFENEEFTLIALPLQHSISCLGYSFVEKDRRRIDMKKLLKAGVKAGPHLKQLQTGEDILFEGKKIKAKDYTALVAGKKISFVTDTLSCEHAVLLAKEADILFCESTYLEDLKEMAKERKHMTAREAGLIAKKAKAKKLVLIHFSQRYTDLSLFSKEAKKVFPNTIAGKDLQVFTV